MPPAVALRGITKRFPAVVANDSVDFEAAAGEVHALLGENGAGKTTLSNILTGLYKPDAGEIELYGEPVRFHSPRGALDAGICMVHQHFRLVAPFTVAENVVLPHKLHEVKAVADRVTVLRGGRSIATVRARDATPRELAALMVGRQIELSSRQERPAPHGVDSSLEIDGLKVRGDRGEEAVKGVSLTVRNGEIVGVAGVAGNGQRELAEAITGIRAPTGGAVRVGGRKLRTGDPRSAIAAGVAHVPEDRLGTGVAPSLSIAENTVLKSYRGPEVSHGPLLRWRAVRRHAVDLIRRYAVHTPGPHLRARDLSG